MGISIRSFSQATVIRSHNHRLRHGLMVNDSLILALMEETGITHLATKDKSFLGMDGIKVVYPQDLRL